MKKTELDLRPPKKEERNNSINLLRYGDDDGGGGDADDDDDDDGWDCFESRPLACPGCRLKLSSKSRLLQGAG